MVIAMFYGEVALENIMCYGCVTGVACYTILHIHSKYLYVDSVFVLAGVKWRCG